MRVIDYRRSSEISSPGDVDSSCRSSSQPDDDDHSDSSVSFYDEDNQPFKVPSATSRSLCSSSTHTESTFQSALTANSNDASLLEEIEQAASLPGVPRLLMVDSTCQPGQSCCTTICGNSGQDDEPDDLDSTCWELEDEEEDEDVDDKSYGHHHHQATVLSPPPTRLVEAETNEHMSIMIDSMSCPATPMSSVRNKVKEKKPRSPKKEPHSPKKKRKSKSSMSSSSERTSTATKTARDELPASIDPLRSKSSHHIRNYDKPESPAEEMLIEMQRTVDGLIRRVRSRIKRAVVQGQKALQASITRHINGGRLTSTLVTMRKFDSYRRRASHWAVVKQRLEDVFLTLERERQRTRFDDVSFTMDLNVALTFTSELRALHAILEKKHAAKDDNDNENDLDGESIHLNARATDKELVQELQELVKALPESQEPPLSPRKSRHQRQHEPGTALSPSKTRRGGKRSSSHGLSTLPTIEAL